MPVRLRLSLQFTLIFLMTWLGAGQASQALGVTLNSQEQAIFNHMAGDGDQQRPFLHLDPTLCSVARARAADMGNRGYYSHTDPDGHGPNWWVRHAGYQLPAGYDQSNAGNNIESIAAAYTDPDDTWGAWMDSSPHRQHLLATNSFYADQTSIGIGVVYVSGSDWGTYWVVITAPPDGPSVNISSPAANVKLTAPHVTLTGTTSGQPAAASVQASVADGPWVNASGVATWSVNLDGLTPGDNVLHVRSLNAAGAVLDSAARTFHYTELAPLTVQMTGSGTVTAGFAGTTQRELGHAYTITAKPAAGWLFDSWSGSLTGTKSTVTFTMSDGFGLVANFIPNPFPASAGAFTGLFASGDLHGQFRATLNPNGTFTARVRYHGAGYGFTGKFDPHGNATVSARLPGGGTLTASLHLDTTGPTPQITGTISDGIFTSALAIDTLNGSTGTNAHAGRYTLALPAIDDSTSATPDGDGIATVIVGLHGTTTLSGTLADGSPLIATTSLTADGNLELYLPLYGGKGLLTGELHFRATDTSDVDGTLYWSKPAQPNNPVLPGAFALNTAAVGSHYVPPAAGQPALDVQTIANNIQFDLGAADFTAPMEQPATLGLDNRIALGAPVVSGLKIALQPASGRFSGTFKNPANGALTSFRGIILQKQNAGFGFFLGTKASGYVTFSPALP